MSKNRLFTVKQPWTAKVHSHITHHTQSHSTSSTWISHRPIDWPVMASGACAADRRAPAPPAGPPAIGHVAASARATKNTIFYPSLFPSAGPPSLPEGVAVPFCSSSNARLARDTGGEHRVQHSAHATQVEHLAGGNRHGFGSFRASTARTGHPGGAFASSHHTLLRPFPLHPSPAGHRSDDVRPPPYLPTLPSPTHMRERQRRYLATLSPSPLTLPPQSHLVHSPTRPAMQTPHRHERNDDIASPFNPHASPPLNASYPLRPLPLTCEKTTTVSGSYRSPGVAGLRSATSVSVPVTSPFLTANSAAVTEARSICAVSMEHQRERRDTKARREVSTNTSRLGRETWGGGGGGAGVTWRRGLGGGGRESAGCAGGGRPGGGGGQVEAGIRAVAAQRRRHETTAAGHAHEIILPSGGTPKSQLHI